MTMIATLLFLPPEMVVMVASYLDVSSYLGLASSSNALLDMCGFFWEIEEEDMKQNVKKWTLSHVFFLEESRQQTPPCLASPHM